MFGYLAASQPLSSYSRLCFFRPFATLSNFPPEKHVYKSWNSAFVFAFSGLRSSQLLAHQIWDRSGPVSAHTDPCGVLELFARFSPLFPPLFFLFLFSSSSFLSPFSPCSLSPVGMLGDTENCSAWAFVCAVRSALSVTC